MTTSFFPGGQCPSLSVAAVPARRLPSPSPRPRARPRVSHETRDAVPSGVSFCSSHGPSPRHCVCSLPCTAQLLSRDLGDVRLLLATESLLSPNRPDSCLSATSVHVARPLSAAVRAEMLSSRRIRRQNRHYHVLRAEPPAHPGQLQASYLKTRTLSRLDSWASWAGSEECSRRQAWASEAASEEYPRHQAWAFGLVEEWGGEGLTCARARVVPRCSRSDLPLPVPCRNDGASNARCRRAGILSCAPA